MDSTMTEREPYVGTGRDGCLRSAQIDLERMDALDAADPRREALADSAMRWRHQARAEAARLEPAVCGDCDASATVQVDFTDGVRWSLCWAHTAFLLVRSTACTVTRLSDGGVVGTPGAVRPGTSKGA